MHINITTQGSNKGSSGSLVQYLEKENRKELKDAPERWSSSQQQTAEAYGVRRALDNNVSKLGKADAKFFLVNISPSQKEIRHLLEKFGDQGAKAELKKYAEKVMDEYAKNFKRPGVESNRDLLWFGKLENFRYFNHTDKEVKNGERKRGEKKDGEQMHIQIIVSRKDITDKIKLSPMNTSRGKNENHSKKLGQFNRVAFKQCGEELFNNVFDFKRAFKETASYAMIQKNGSLQQKEKLDVLEKGVDINPDAKPLAFKLAKEISMERTPAFFSDFFMSNSKEGLLESLLKVDSVAEQKEFYQGKRKKRKYRSHQT
ncbi:molybdopterin-guanine dinucleotide biosynthesis protein MobB [Pelobium manganitolerans]|uniref:Molybdopterin-guanine dinucleotide biosynthesis protein MobB n=1 Tax=Pelobium manganitolerans TaxID=1842495 RepID=A0A419S5X9_9SPHI|nr:DUF5712 family protein [Pelobium manganitolerans]RKD16244.1 molybdopterin-guanine dinucleotide biosynthesis protein MobB [Pelobium manganitolerans]